MMSGSSEFVSVFKINGRPIIPPALTPRRRKEMQEYKMKALAVEKRLKEKKKEQRNSDGILVLLDEGKENKETESIYRSTNEDSVYDSRYHGKCVIWERESLKELNPQFLQKSIYKTTMTGDLQGYGDCLDETYSVALTESTDLHPYLNSYMEDEFFSSEAECATEFASAPKHTADEACCNALQYKCNCGENVGIGYIKCGQLSECTASHVSSFSNKETHVMNITTVNNILDSQVTSEEMVDVTEVDDMASSCKSSVFYESEMKLLEANVEDDNNEDGCNYTSFPSSLTPLASVSVNNNNVDIGVTASQETSSGASTMNDSLLPSQTESLPPHLIRSGSFTLETPSPLLIANIERYTIDTVVQDSTPSNIIEKTIDCHLVNDSEGLNGQCISSENLRSLPLSSPKDCVDIQQGKGTKLGIKVKIREAPVDHRKGEPLKGSIQRGSVFERLAADAAKKAEERRKLSRKNITEVFKVPKKVTRAASRGMRPSISASNLRISLSGVHKSRSNALAWRRSNSEANVSTAHRKSIMSAANPSQKQNSLTQVASATLRKPVVMDARSFVGKDVEPVIVETSKDTHPLHIEKDLQVAGIPDEYTPTKLPATQFNNVEEIKANHPDKIVYCVQTSPISPPFPHQLNVCSGNSNGDSPAIQGGRRRRRWSVGWSGWVTSVGEQSESDSHVNDIENCSSAEPLQPMPENYIEGSVLLTNSDNNSNSNSVSVSETTFQTLKIAPSLEKTLNSLPASPVGAVDVKETALKLLERLVEEQDKAMAHLLDDQRKQAEKLKERFQMQQKCLIEKVAHLVSSLSTSQIRKSKAPHSPQLSEATIPTYKENMTLSKSPLVLNQYAIASQPLTPVPTSRGLDYENQLSPTFSSQQEMLSQLRFDDVVEEIPSKDMANELEIKLIKFPEEENMPLVENSFCQSCLSIHSNCRCSSPEESSCTSTIKEEITDMSVGSLQNDTASVGGICDSECNITNDKTICSSSPFQEANDCNLIPSSVKPEKNIPVNLSSLKTDSAPQEGVLDLSEILEMELGHRGGNTMSQTPHLSIDKSKRKLEEIHCNATLSSAHSVITINVNSTISPLGDLPSYRRMYEQDLQRLTSFDSDSEKQNRDIDGLLANEPVSSIKDHLRSPGNWTLTTDDRGQTNEGERRDSQFHTLPDLRGEVLQAYLGSQTPSMDPVFLQTPVASAVHQGQPLLACSIPAEPYENGTFNGLPQKEVQCMEDDHSPVLNSPVIRESLECKENLELSPNELHLSIRSSSSSSITSFPRDQLSSERHPSSTNSSENYTTASSKCHSEEFIRLEKGMLLKFGKLSALIKGYLTRRLMKTEKICKIKMIIRDLMVTAVKVHSEVSQEEDVNPNDVRLHGQILTELNATCEEFHRVFFEMTRAQQMAIISSDRQRLISSPGSLAAVDVAEVINSRPALLSAVTLKTLQRRFSMYSPKNRVEGTAKSKCDDKQLTQKKMSSVGVVAGQRMATRAKRKEINNIRPTSRALSISADLNSKSVSRNVKASKVSLAHKGSTSRTANAQTKPSRRKRRSASAGEIKRKPWH